MHEGILSQAGSCHVPGDNFSSCVFTGGQIEEGPAGYPAGRFMKKILC